MTAHISIWGGAALLAGGVVWLVQRIDHHRVQLVGLREGGAALFSLLVILVSPWLCWQLLWVRGFEYVGVGFWDGSGTSIRTGLAAQLFVGLLLINLVTAPQEAGISRQFLAEQVGCLVVLPLAWVLAFQSTSLLTTLLWLEVAGLLAILVLGFFGAGGWGGLPWSSDWTRGVVMQATHRGLIGALLLLLWVNGLSTILFLWAWALALLGGWGLDFGQLYLLIAGTGTGASFVGILVGVGLLVKCMLQPFQFFLFSFYRLLPLSAFLYYLTAYYSTLLIVLVRVLATPLASLLGGWGFGVLATLPLALVTLVGGLGGFVDVRITLAFSTLLNLTFLLLGVACVGNGGL